MNPTAIKILLESLKRDLAEAVLYRARLEGMPPKNVDFRGRQELLKQTINRITYYTQRIAQLEASLPAAGAAEAAEVVQTGSRFSRVLNWIRGAASATGRGAVHLVRTVATVVGGVLTTKVIIAGVVVGVIVGGVVYYYNRPGSPPTGPSAPVTDNRPPAQPPVPAVTPPTTPPPAVTDNPPGALLQTPGKHQRIVPNLKVFDSVSEMRAVLRHADLVGRFSASPNATPSKQNEFRCDSQTPEPNTIVNENSVVSVTIYQAYQGKGDTVPGIVGIDQEMADSILRSAGLVPLRAGTTPAPGRGLTGLVFSQQPSAGQPFPADRRVSYSVYGTPAGPAGPAAGPPPATWEGKWEGPSKVRSSSTAALSGSTDTHRLEFIRDGNQIKLTSWTLYEMPEFRNQVRNLSTVLTATEGHFSVEIPQPEGTVFKTTEDFRLENGVIRGTRVEDIGGMKLSIDYELRKQ